jgi:hypothetical protein
MFAITVNTSFIQKALMSNKYIYITLLSLLGFSTEAIAQTVQQAPKLVVSIAIEQLRTDRLEAYAPLYQSQGLKRLLQEGLVFPHASYSFTPVDRASATASLMTGSVPYYNGITGIEWMDRHTLRPQNSVNDQQHLLSPQQLATSTLSDELKISTNGVAKVFAFAAEAECAILSAGHAADGAVCLSGNQWQMASYYTPVNQWLTWYTRQYKPIGDINSCLTEMALRCVEQSGIGQDDITDLLSISYQIQPDEIGYQMLDRYIADLINGIHRKLPPDRVLFVITGTGTTEEEHEEENERFRIPTGKFYINRTANLLNMYLGAVYGSAQYVEASYRNQLFLNNQLIDKKNINRAELMRQAQEFLLQISGIRHVYTVSQLLTSDSPLLQRVRNGYYAEKCGDILIDIAPGWELINEETNSSSVSRISYIPFPIIFFGANIKAQRIQTPVTVDRIAPTVAKTIHIRAPNGCATEPLF